MARQDAAPGRGWSEDEAARLYGAHRLALVRLAVLLLEDLPCAEDVVHGAFADFLSRSRSLRDPDRALAYLRSSVVKRSAAAARAARAAHTGQVRLTLQHGRILDAVRGLPVRQREVLVLRFWCELTEARTAETLSVSRGMVRSSVGRALAALDVAEEPLAEALRARADQVGAPDLRPPEMPAAARSRRPLVLAVAAIAACVAAAVPFLAGSDEPHGPVHTPEGALRMDVNGDGGPDVVSVDFDPAARTYQLTVDLFHGPSRTHQGLALERPTLVGPVDLDADGSAEMALDVGNVETTALPDFFRYVDGALVRLDPPDSGREAQGWSATSKAGRFALREGRLVTWEDAPDGSEEPAVVRFWRWRVVGDRILPDPAVQRCLVGTADRTVVPEPC